MTAVTQGEADILGLETGDTDPVRIILAAQLRLRQWRRRVPPGSGMPQPEEVRRIIAARDALLQKAVGALTARGLGRSDGEPSPGPVTRRTAGPA